jgi:hypothetical protein
MVRTLLIEPLGRTIAVEEHQTLLEAALAPRHPATQWLPHRQLLRVHRPGR